MKGQGYTVMGIVMAFIGIFLLSIISRIEAPLIQNVYYNASLGTPPDPTTAMIVSLVIPTQWLMVLVGPVVWTLIQRGRDQRGE